MDTTHKIKRSEGAGGQVPLLLLLVLTLYLSSCKKDDNKQTQANAATVATNKGSLIWKAGAAAAVTVDSAYCFSSITTIYAFKTGLSNSIEINLSALSVGNYSLSSVTGDDLIFVTGSTVYTSSSGNCNITAAANNKLSGNFSAALTGGTLTVITGTFTDILIK